MDFPPSLILCLREGPPRSPFLVCTPHRLSHLDLWSSWQYRPQSYGDESALDSHWLLPNVRAYLPEEGGGSA